MCRGHDPPLAAGLGERRVVAGRLAGLAALSTPLCVTLPEGGAWCPDLAEYEKSVQVRFEERTAGLEVGERLVLFDPPELALCEWARRTELGTLVVGRGRSRARRLLQRDTVGSLARHAPCAVLVVTDATSPPAARHESRS